MVITIVVSHAGPYGPSEENHSSSIQPQHSCVEDSHSHLTVQCFLIRGGATAPPAPVSGRGHGIKKSKYMFSVFFLSIFLEIIPT